MDKIKPIVINSKRADQHYLDIVSEHEKMLSAIENQALRVSQYKEQQDAVENQRQQMKMINDRDMLEQQNKQRELEIKAQALSI